MNINDIKKLRKLAHNPEALIAWADREEALIRCLYCKELIVNAAYVYPKGKRCCPQCHHEKERTNA